MNYRFTFYFFISFHFYLNVIIINEGVLFFSPIDNHQVSHVLFLSALCGGFFFSIK